MTSNPLSMQLAHLLLDRRQRGIPADVRHKTVLHIADAVAIGMAAAHSGGLAVQVGQAVGAGAGAGPCRVIGRQGGLAPNLAAFANSALIHILDFDDIHDEARLHPTVVTLPAALAAADLARAPAARVVDAVALGNELLCRMGVMCSPTGDGPGSDWFLTQLFGYLGASLAAGIVLDLSEEAIVSSFGLAYMQAAGGKEAGFGVGATARGIYPAFAAMGGMHAALLAQAGVVGPPGALDGAAGLFKLYLGGAPSSEQLRTLLDETSWHFRATQIKPWPSCRLSHPYVAAALDVRATLQDAPIERIVVKVNGSAAKLCRPLEQRRRPQTLQDAKYSIPYMTAFTLANGAVTLQTLDVSALGDARVLTLAQRVEIEHSLPDRPGHPPAQISVYTHDGRRYDSRYPLDFDLDAVGVKSKFEACLAYADSADRAEALWRSLERLDEADGIDAIYG